VKTLIDLVRQVGVVAPVPETARAARQAAEALHRGVVSISSTLDEVAGDGVALGEPDGDGGNGAEARPTGTAPVRVPRDAP
jgi:hypothetical protein